MRKRWMVLGLLLMAGLVLGLALVQRGQSQPPPPPPANLPQRVAQIAGVPVNNVEKVLTALGPAVQEELSSGKQVDFAGLGTFRVVRIPEHRDLVNGRPAIIAAENYVEFLPQKGVIKAANAPKAVPATVVEPFHYVPFPNRVPRRRTPGQRVPRRRIP
jgi:nucleoid DNA-binding protein